MFKSYRCCFQTIRRLSSRHDAVPAYFGVCLSFPEQGLPGDERSCEVCQSQRNEPLEIAAPTAHDLARMKIGGKGFGIETRHGEKGRNTIDLGLAEIPDIRERDG